MIVNADIRRIAYLIIHISVIEPAFQCVGTMNIPIHLGKTAFFHNRIQIFPACMYGIRINVDTMNIFGKMLLYRMERAVFLPIGIQISL